LWHCHVFQPSLWVTYIYASSFSLPLSPTGLSLANFPVSWLIHCSRGTSYMEVLDTSSRTMHVTSSMYRRTFNSPPLGTLTPLITLSLLICCARGSMAQTKSPGDSGHPCLTPESTAKASPRKPLTSTLLIALP
uniref:Uncharacterized protein n=1 Tax=Crocodylus porosus TaxID=8502 RepID=A0A7M4FYM2_CROPO